MKQAKGGSDLLGLAGRGDRIQGAGMINMGKQAPISALVVLVAYCSRLIGNRAEQGKVTTM